MNQNFLTSGGLFDVPKKQEIITELENKINEEGFWDNISKANEINKELSFLKKELTIYQDINSRINSAKELLELLKVEEDETLIKEIEHELSTINKDYEELEINTLLNGEYDNLNCYLEIHPGAGGTESCDWASMLLEMYQGFCNKNEYTYEIIDEQKGEEAGIKNATILIKGINAYGYLKCENGVHRLVRISPFDSNHRRHTSFASITVTPEFSETPEIEVKETDLKIDVYRSSGAGGQSVNTTDSAVRITHLPSKIVVTCQNERSQLQNKEHAMKILMDKLYKLELEKKEEKMKSLNGVSSNINFGSQIRSYVLEPYTMVKDHRTDYEISNADAVLKGNINDFIESILKMNSEN